ncbi:MAG: monovalent cation/H+ antiporter subunit D family protein [Spongiibacteraceae bacterium]
MMMETQLLWIIALPLLAAVAIGLVGQRYANIREAITLITGASLAWLVWSLFPEVLAGARPAAHLVSILPGISLEFKIEPLGMLFAALASLLWIVNSIYSIGYMRGNNEQHQTRFYVCFAVAIAGAMGVAMAENLLTLFVFYEVLTLSTYPLVAHKGDAKSVAAARVYLGILLATSMGLLLPAIIWTYSVTGTLAFTSGGILEGHVAGPAVGLLLALFVFGTGKAALMPVHKWLPSAMVAPTPVSALLHAVAVVKAGVFTITKIVVYIFGIDFLAASPSSGWLVYAAVFTIVAASFIALRQTNLKRLLAYSTIAQLSYVILATALLVPFSVMAAALHIVAHAFGKITLFFAAGSIYTASKKTELAQLHGIGRRMPWTMGAFTIGALSMIGVPPTAGFISKWYLLTGSFQAENYLAIAAIVVSTLLNAAYFLPIVYNAWFKAESEPPAIDHREAPLAIVIALSITASLTVMFFWVNQPAIDLAAQMVGAK